MVKKVILASRSPQRKRILADMQIDFRAIPADIDEHHSGLRRPHAIARGIAYRKALAVAKKHRSEWVLGCDTIVVHADKALSLKPKDRSHARATLQKYSASHCDVYSGLALMNRSLMTDFKGFERTRLHFRRIGADEIEAYLDEGDWKESSGSMTIEGRAGEWVKRIEGEYWNVVGLPVELLKNFLTQAMRHEEGL